MYDTNDFIMLPIPVSKYTAVCALLGGASLSVASAPVSSAPASGKAVVASPVTAPASEPSGNTGETAPVGTGPTATTDASPSDVPVGAEGVDAHGHPWSAALHASTGSKTKENLWRMKPGVTRPDPLPGFPKEDGATGTNISGAAAPLPSDAATTGSAGPATDVEEEEEEDEFAAFSAALAKDDAAPASIPVRKWTDADLGALCNQAAQKLGDPAPVKAIITEYVAGTGATAHSRNIPDDKRDAFAKAIEAKAGIQFAG